MGWTVSCCRLLCQHNALGIAGIVAANESAVAGSAAVRRLPQGPHGGTARLHRCGLSLPTAKASTVHFSGGRQTGVSLWLVLLAGPRCR